MEGLRKSVNTIIQDFSTPELLLNLPDFLHQVNLMADTAYFRFPEVKKRVIHYPKSELIIFDASQPVS